jgi:hypothetical protein
VALQVAVEETTAAAETVEAAETAEAAVEAAGEVVDAEADHPTHPTAADTTEPPVGEAEAGMAAAAASAATEVDADAEVAVGDGNANHPHQNSKEVVARSRRCDKYICKTSRCYYILKYPMSRIKLTRNDNFSLYNYILKDRKTTNSRRVPKSG